MNSVSMDVILELLDEDLTHLEKYILLDDGNRLKLGYSEFFWEQSPQAPNIIFVREVPKVKNFNAVDKKLHNVIEMCFNTPMDFIDRQDRMMEIFNEYNYSYVPFLLELVDAKMTSKAIDRHEICDGYVFACNDDYNVETQIIREYLKKCVNPKGYLECFLNGTLVNIIINKGPTLFENRSIPIYDVGYVMVEKYGVDPNIKIEDLIEDPDSKPVNLLDLFKRPNDF